MYEGRLSLLNVRNTRCITTCRGLSFSLSLIPRNRQNSNETYQTASSPNAPCFPFVEGSLSLPDLCVAR